MNNLTIVSKENQRVLTTQQLAEVYNVGEERIRQSFNRNQERFIEGKHYFKLEGEELKEFKREYLKDTSSKISSLMLWTEKGADRHCKILDTDEAWEQFDNLEETYFRVKENVQTKKLSALEQLQLQNRAILEVNEKVDKIQNDMPLFKAECDELQSLVRKTGVNLMGGKNSPSYKDNSLRGRVYSDIQHQLRREFGVDKYAWIKHSQFNHAKEIVLEYELPKVLKDEIKSVNNQVSFEDAI